MNDRKIKFIEVTSELGAGTRGASLGPDALYYADLNEEGDWMGKFPSVKVKDLNNILRSGDTYTYAKNIDAIAEITNAIANEVENTLNEGSFPVVLSGDHSNAAGTIAGIKNFYSDKKIGVIWVDAHADMHTPYTTPSGNVHGMPLAAALGIDNKSRTINDVSEEAKTYWETMKLAGSRKISPKVAAEDIVFIDIRDLESQEWALLKELNIKYFEPADRKKIGVEEIAKQTLAYLNSCDIIYISFDVDSMDPSVSAGTGTSVDDGLSLDEAKNLLHYLMNDAKTTVLEVTEINPLLDTENKMAKAALSILKHLF
jgi:arginase